MKISHRLIAGNIVVVLLVASVGIFGIFSDNKIVTAFESEEKHFRVIVTSATEVSSYAKRAEGHLMLFLTLRDRVDRGKFFAHCVSLSEEIKILDMGVKVPEARVYVEGIKEKTNQLLPAGKALLEAFDRDISTRNAFMFERHESEIRKFDKIASEIRQLAVDLAIFEADLSHKAHRSAINSAAVFRSYDLAIILGAVLLALIQGAVLSRKIASPISDLTNKVTAVSGGDLDVSVEYESRDEIGTLTSSFNSMLKALKDSQHELVTEKERLLVTLRSIGDGVITTDTEGNIVLLNTVAETLTGWTQKEASGKSLHEVFQIIHEETRACCENPVEKVMKTKKIVELANHTSLIARDGTERAIADSGAPILDENGVIIGVVLVFRDVTETQRMEDELLKARNIESLGILAGGIAHDFNNLLVGILGNVSLAKRKFEKEDKVKLMEKLTGVEKAAFRAKDLTHQLLTFSRGGSPILKTTSISALIMESAKFALAGSNLMCDFFFSEDLSLVDADRGQLSQVIHNLIVNAKLAMPEGGIIEIKGKNIVINEQTPRRAPLADGTYVQITVTDEGTGIPAETLPKIFDPYFTTREGGSGLGLATAYSIIKRHGGLLSAESVIGKGASFHIYLPASPKTILTEPDNRGVAGGKGRVLLMDDENIVRETASEMLADLGYDAVMSRNGREAVELYKAAMEAGMPFDVVVLDLTVPGGTGGKEAMKELLRIDPKVRAIVSSGYSNNPVMAEFEHYGFMGVLTKPYHIEELGTLLNGLIS